MIDSTTPDILTFGEAMTLFIAETPGDLAEVERFQRRIAGADTNVAIGLARLAFHVAWISRVGDDGFGTFIRRTLESEDLDCRYLSTDTEHPTGLVFKERAEHGEDPKVAYYRRGSAASHLSVADVGDLDFQGVRHLHATGLPPALSPSTRELAFHMLERAREAGLTISFDPNLRPSLWNSEAEMRETLNALAAHADWVLPGLAEGQRLTGLDNAHDIAGYYLDRGASGVIIKLGPEGSYVRTADDAGMVKGVAAAHVVDTVGAGDGFAVGVISALLDGGSPRQAAHRGNLIGAEQVQVVGDMEGLPHRDRLRDLEAAHPMA
ncbi:sugar kinase [Chromohalobacter sp. 11-W]|uniref:sugar kinase n=1 Tax=Chromohalobacter sp. 11-W TaxID=2994061 RepID=UPI002468E27F|nr:sugar kinase [Chromohalobacter sp. 11-W]